MHSRICFGFALLGLAAAANGATLDTCASLLHLQLKYTTITTAVPVAAGAFTLPQPPASGAKPPSFASVPAFCRVAGAIKPTSDSDIEFEVWLPAQWNGKFQGIGNGGFAGQISYGPVGGLGGAVSRGYATASTDTGHQAKLGTDASWAVGHHEKIVDYGYRAIHLMTEDAKAIIKAFYGSGPRRSYFDSCSNGGRQALMEAQRFPADYDGIIAGAPANYFTHLGAAFIWDSQALYENPASFIPPAKLPAIQAATLAACDARDGLKDGLIDQPSKCGFDASKLLCRGPETDSCLTQPQVTALEKIYAGAHNAKGQVYPGWPVGGETGRGGWAAWVTGIAPKQSLHYLFGTGLMAGMVFQNPAWDYKTFNFDRDMKVVDDRVGNLINSTDPNLKPFKDRGGKLIIYHGWSDGAISALSTIDYYNSVVSKMGQKDVSAFTRLFLVPGMQHCGGGPGPNVFTQPGPNRDPEHDIDMALEQWVEKGTAPERIVATKFKSDAPPRGEAVRTRPLCPYPQVARYKGSGSIDAAENFTCATK